MSNPQTQTSDELEIAEAQNSLFDLLYDYGARALTTRIGQFAYRRVDGLLSVAEKTARWSLPQPPPSEDDGGKLNISGPPLIRPLPWLLFLPALIVMRLVRTSLSLLALMLGKQPVYPSTVVTFLQTKRRKLRALKYRGQKLERIDRAERQNEDEVQTTWLSRITLPLRMVICTRTAGNRASRTMIYHHPRHHHQHHQSHTAKKRNINERDDGDSDDSLEGASCNDLLEKYASAEGDSSFNADEVSSGLSDTSISETEKSTVEEDSSAQPQKSPAPQKERNGHTPVENSSASEETTHESKKSGQSKQRSSLNVESNTSQPKKASGPAENGPVEANKQSQDQKTVSAANRSKSAANLDGSQTGADAQPKPSKSTPNLTPSESENNENKPMNQNDSSKDQSGDNRKNDHESRYQNPARVDE